MDKMQKLMLFFSVVCFAFSGLMASGAWADSTEYKNYGRLTLGMNQPTGDLDDAGFDTGFNITGTYGRYLAKNLVVEGTVGSFFTDLESKGSAPFTGNYDRRDIVSASAILGTIKGEFPMGPVALFAGGGVGFYVVALDTELDTAFLGKLDAEDSDFVFGAHMVFGGHFNITPRVFVGLEGLYRWTTEYDLRDRVGTIPVEIEADLNGYTLCLSGGFRF